MAISRLVFDHLWDEISAMASNGLDYTVAAQNINPESEVAKRGRERMVPRLRIADGTQPPIDPEKIGVPQLSIDDVPAPVRTAVEEAFKCCFAILAARLEEDTQALSDQKASLPLHRARLQKLNEQMQIPDATLDCFDCAAVLAESRKRKDGYDVLTDRYSKTRGQAVR